MAAKYLPAIVIDNGSSQFKAGFAGDNAPKCCFPTVIGQSKRQSVMVGLQGKEFYIGDEAQAMRGVLNLKYPIVNGVVNNWDEMERIFHHFYEEQIRVNPQEHPLLITETPLNPKENREKLAEIMFENFDIPAFYATIPAILSFYASGRETGIIVDSGHSITHTVPIFEGHAVPHAITKIDFAGRACTDWLGKIMSENDIHFPSSSEREIVSDIKEKLCYVALDYEQELIKFKLTAENHVEYELPDGDVITIRDQRFRCPEVLFKPHFIGLKMCGIHELTFKSIKKCDIDTRKTFFQNIVLTGGTTLFHGLPERLSKEVTGLAPKSMKIKVVSLDDKKYSAWIGGSIVANLPSFQEQWITKEEFDEIGAHIVHRTCFLHD